MNVKLPTCAVHVLLMFLYFLVSCSSDGAGDGVVTPSRDDGTTRVAASASEPDATSEAWSREDVIGVPEGTPAPASQPSKADLDCVPANNTANMPSSARDYAALCAEHGLGVPPQISCDDGVRVPTTVDGQEVFESVSSCDHTSMLKPACVVGSKIGRVQGHDEEGTALPEVVWVYFCRAASQTSISSVQMIGYHYESGATCFFEANEGPDSILPELLGRDAQNGLTGQMPAADDADFDRAFIPAPDQCVQCHQNNAFIRNPWLDGAVLPEDPTQPVLPTVGALSPYYVVGGADWDMRTIHIEGNACLSCHRIGMEIDQIFSENGFDTNTYMPPHAPGSMGDDYQALYDCWQAGPENTPGCDWIIPPAGDCEGGVVGPDYPYASSSFNLSSSGSDGSIGGTDGSACPQGTTLGGVCLGDAFSTACTVDGVWFWCENGAWESK